MSDRDELVWALSYMIGMAEGHGHRVPAWVHNVRSQSLREPEPRTVDDHLLCMRDTEGGWREYLCSCGTSFGRWENGSYVRRVDFPEHLQAVRGAAL